jgi:hypothetical protein
MAFSLLIFSNKTFTCNPTIRYTYAIRQKKVRYIKKKPVNHVWELKAVAQNYPLARVVVASRYNMTFRLLHFNPNKLEIRISTTSKGPSTLLVLVWLAMLASNVYDDEPWSADYSLYILRVNIRILRRRSLASNWSSVGEDLRAQVKARRVSQRARAWRATEVVWTKIYEHK